MYGGRNNLYSRPYLQCKHYRKNGHEAYYCRAPWDSIKERHNQNNEDKSKSQEAGKIMNLLIVLLDFYHSS